MALPTHTETNGKLGLIENFIETLLPADWDTWDLDRQLMFWSSGFGPEQKGTVTALGKLEDSLEKLEPKTFWGVMTRFRQRRGVSQASFAAALHISRDTVKAIEANKNTPSYETLLAITDVYNIPLDTLRFAFRRYAFHLKDEAIDYMINRQDNPLTEPTMYRNIGALLQCERRFISKSRKQLSDMSGISATMIAKYESGEVDIAWPVLRQFGMCVDSERLLEVCQKLKNRAERRRMMI